jgi:hypothetical protein
MDVATPQQQIIDACEAHFQANIHDCSGFAKAVAGALGINLLSGMANDIVDEIQNAPWTVLADGIAAKARAEAGCLVIGAKKDDPHGHVVVVVPGPLAHEKYPAAYWGSLAGHPSEIPEKTTVNWAWRRPECDQVIYACVPLPV